MRLVSEDFKRGLEVQIQQSPRTSQVIRMFFFFKICGAITGLPSGDHRSLPCFARECSHSPASLDDASVPRGGTKIIAYRGPESEGGALFHTVRSKQSAASIILHAFARGVTLRRHLRCLAKRTCVVETSEGTCSHG